MSTFMFVGHSLFTCYFHALLSCSDPNITHICIPVCVCVCAQTVHDDSAWLLQSVCMCVSVLLSHPCRCAEAPLSLSFSLSSISCSGDSGSSSSAGLSSETASSLPSESFSPEQQSCVSPLLLILCVLLIMILWVKMGEDSLEELVRRLTVIVHKIGRRSCEWVCV